MSFREVVDDFVIGLDWELLKAQSFQKSNIKSKKAQAPPPTDRFGSSDPKICRWWRGLDALGSDGLEFVRNKEEENPPNAEALVNPKSLGKLCFPRFSSWTPLLLHYIILLSLSLRCSLENGTNPISLPAPPVCFMPIDG